MNKGYLIQFKIRGREECFHAEIVISMQSKMFRYRINVSDAKVEVSFSDISADDNDNTKMNVSDAKMNMLL